jgi:hypothetical protein
MDAARPSTAWATSISLSFEDLTPRLGPAGEDLIIWKTLCFERAEKGFGLGVIITISYPTHAQIGSNNTQGFAYGLATVLTASTVAALDISICITVLSFLSAIVIVVFLGF